MGQKKKKKERINYLPNNKSAARKITNTASSMTCGNLFTARCNIGIALGYICAHMHKKNSPTSTLHFTNSISPLSIKYEKCVTNLGKICLLMRNRSGVTRHNI